MWWKSESQEIAELKKEVERLKKLLEISELALKIEKKKQERPEFTEWEQMKMPPTGKVMKMTRPEPQDNETKELMRHIDQVYRRLNRNQDG